jgi:hypothetical protein
LVVRYPSVVSFEMRIAMDRLMKMREKQVIVLMLSV